MPFFLVHVRRGSQPNTILSPVNVGYAGSIGGSPGRQSTAEVFIGPFDTRQLADQYVEQHKGLYFRIEGDLVGVEPTDPPARDSRMGVSRRRIRMPRSI